MPDAYLMAADLLDRVGAYFAERSVPLPDVRYVAPGSAQTLAWDEDTDGTVRECVTVSLGYVAAGQPGAEAAPARGSVLRYAEFGVTILRSAAIQEDGGGAPAPGVIQADGQINIRDTQTLHLALEHIRAGCLSVGGWAERGTTVAVGRTLPIGPMGAAVAAVGTIQAAI